MHFSSKRLAKILGAFQRNRILVIDNLVPDEFLRDQVMKLSKSTTHSQLIGKTFVCKLQS